jgi:hypothetical protein
MSASLGTRPLPCEQVGLLQQQLDRVLGVLRRVTSRLSWSTSSAASALSLSSDISSWSMAAFSAEAQTAEQNATHR